MSTLSCPDCVAFDEDVVAMKARVAELEAAAKNVLKHGAIDEECPHVAALARLVGSDSVGIEETHDLVSGSRDDARAGTSAVAALGSEGRPGGGSDSAREYGEQSGDPQGAGLDRSDRVARTSEARPVGVGDLVTLDGGPYHGKLGPSRVSRIGTRPGDAGLWLWADEDTPDEWTAPLVSSSLRHADGDRVEGQRPKEPLAEARAEADQIRRELGLDDARTSELVRPDQTKYVITCDDEPRTDSALTVLDRLLQCFTEADDGLQTDNLEKVASAIVWGQEIVRKAQRTEPASHGPDAPKHSDRTLSKAHRAGIEVGRKEAMAEMDRTETPSHEQMAKLVEAIRAHADAADREVGYAMADRCGRDAIDERRFKADGARDALRVAERFMASVTGGGEQP